MAQTGFTPISIYYSSTSTNVPTAGNLVAGELAINTADGKLFYKDSAGVVQVIGTKGGVGSSTTTQVLYNSSGLVVGSANMTFNGTTFTLANDALINGITAGKGGGNLSSSTVFGYQAMNATATGTENAAFGHSALKAVTSGQYNTGIGYFALSATTSPSSNTAVGNSALRNNTTGLQNSALGESCMSTNSTGSSNVAFGYAALVSNTTGSNNTAVGYQALYTQSGGTNRNTALGQQAGYSATNGQECTFIGYQAGYAVTSGGGDNTFVGGFAGSAVTSGYANTIIGKYTGNSGTPALDIRTSNNNIVLSDGAGQQRLWINSNGTIETYANVNGDVAAYFNNRGNSSPFGISMSFLNAAPNNASQYFYFAGDSSTTRFVAMSNGGIKNYAANNVILSDSREKTNFAPAKSYLDVICSIPVQTFNYIDQNLENDAGLTLGVTAQDVQAVAPELVTEGNWGTEEEPKMRLEIYQTDLQYAMMKALQELKAEFDAYKATHP